MLTALVGLAASGGIVWAVRLIGTAALRREAMGFGDVTLMMMIGAFLGWQAGLMLFFLAPFAGLVIGLLQFVLRRDDVIPLRPVPLPGGRGLRRRLGADLELGSPAIRPWRLGAGDADRVPCAAGGAAGVWRIIKEWLFGRGA